MNEWLGIISTFFGIIASLFVGIKYLFNMWYDKEKNLSEYKHSLILKEVDSLKTVSKELQHVITIHSNRLKDLQLSVEKSYLQYNSQADSLKIISQDLKDSTKDIRTELNSMQSQIIQLGQHVTLYKTMKS